MSFAREAFEAWAKRQRPDTLLEKYQLNGFRREPDLELFDEDELIWVGE